MKNKNSSKAGFTLIEILIAVLIIGVLTTIALPMYQGAVDKSKWARLIAPARAVSTAQEAAFMNYGGYTANMDDLDVSLPEGNDMTYTLYTTTNGDDANFIRITSTQLDDVRLAKYYKNNEGFEDQLYCEARNGNDRANKLCGKLLKGQELISTEDDYKMYLIEERANEVLCNRMNLWWSKNFTNCYLTEEQRCTANNMQYDIFCGWTDAKNQTINEGGRCEAANGHYACRYSTINDGGVCVGSEALPASQGYACNNSTINSGGKCIATTTASCQNSTVNDGGECVAEKTRGCDGSIINEGGKCIAKESETQSGCDAVRVNAGGECVSEAGNKYGCKNAVVYGGKCTAEAGSFYGCHDASFYEGGTCDGSAYHRAGPACYRTNYHSGGTCLGNAQQSCYLSRFYDGGICEGNATGTCNGALGNQNHRFDSGSICNGNVANSCNSSGFLAGSTCNGRANDTCAFNGGNFAGTCNGYAAGSCGTGKTASYNITFTDGAVCNGHVSGSCKGIFDSGSRCVANVAGACAGTYQNGGCCEGGDNCPANAPRC